MEFFNRGWLEHPLKAHAEPRTELSRLHTLLHAQRPVQAEELGEAELQVPHLLKRRPRLEREIVPEHVKPKIRQCFERNLQSAPLQRGVNLLRSAERARGGPWVGAGAGEQDLVTKSLGIRRQCWWAEMFQNSRLVRARRGRRLR